MVVPRTEELTEYSCPLASARKIAGIGAPGGMTKVVFRPSSEIDTGAKAGRALPFFIMLKVMGNDAGMSCVYFVQVTRPDSVNPAAKP